MSASASVHEIPRPGKITTSVVAVDPATACRWLENYNTHNRDLSESKIDEYARDMREGRWAFNGETIQFDSNGVLLNGQHRLWAVVTSETTQTFLIVRGVAPEAQITMDQGTRRSPAEQMKIADISGASKNVAGGDPRLSSMD